MHGAPGLMFCIPPVRSRIFTRVAATLSLARTERALLTLDGRERVLLRSIASRRNLMRIARSLWRRRAARYRRPGP